MSGGNGLGFDSYWSQVDAEVAALRGSAVDVEELPERSTDFSTGYGVRLASTEGFRVFGYYSVPRGEGPFPGLFMAPGYGSVVHVPPYERRRRYAVFALCHRGQRLSDDRYAAEYPGLLTDRVEDADRYPWRGIVADCLRAVDFLLDRPEVDSTRLGASGTDLAIIAAALRPQVGVLLVQTGLLFRAAMERLGDTDAYPLEEFNDYLRVCPHSRAAMAATLGLFDPLRFAARVAAKTRISCAASEKPFVDPLASALGDRGELRVLTGRGFVDHSAEEAWLARMLSA